MPPVDVKAFYDEINAEYDFNTGLYTVPCKGHKADVIGFRMTTGSFFGVSQNHYVIDLDLPNGKCVLAVESNSGSNYESSDVVFGTPAARAFCWQVDLEQNTLQAFEHRK